jgi:parvulin-like peptidyl-prolyl isomerase
MKSFRSFFPDLKSNMPLTINGEPIDEQVLREERQRLRRQYAQVYETLQQASRRDWLDTMARQNIVSQVLMRQQAWSDPEPVPTEAIDREIQRQFGSDRRTVASEEEKRQAEERLRILRLIARATEHVQKPTRKEVDLHYKTHRSEFNAPERVRARQIVKNVDETATREAALAAIQEAEAALAQGEEFGAVADKYSDCGGNGGDLGWFAPGVMVDEFEEIAFKLPVGERSPIFETRFGFHIVEVTERRDAGIQPLSEVREQLAATLLDDRRRKAVARFIDEVAARSDIRYEAAAAATAAKDE